MSFVLQSLEILETNQTYTSPAMEKYENKQLICFQQWRRIKTKTN